VLQNTMASASGLSLPDEAPLLHFVRRQDMVAWAPVSLASPRRPRTGPFESGPRLRRRPTR
jgi:hypothetical protein